MIHEPVWLLLNREEFGDVVNRSPVTLDTSVHDIIFRWTIGHVGTVTNLLRSLSYQVSVV